MSVSLCSVASVSCRSIRFPSPRRVFRTQEAECDVGQKHSHATDRIVLRCAMQIFVKMLTRKAVTFDVERLSVNIDDEKA